MRKQADTIPNLRDVIAKINAARYTREQLHSHFTNTTQLAATQMLNSPSLPHFYQNLPQKALQNGFGLASFLFSKGKGPIFLMRTGHNALEAVVLTRSMRNPLQFQRVTKITGGVEPEQEAINISPRELNEKVLYYAPIERAKKVTKKPFARLPWIKLLSNGKPDIGHALGYMEDNLRRREEAGFANTVNCRDKQAASRYLTEHQEAINKGRKQVVGRAFMGGMKLAVDFVVEYVDSETQQVVIRDPKTHAVTTLLIRDIAALAGDPRNIKYQRMLVPTAEDVQRKLLPFVLRKITGERDTSLAFAMREKFIAWSDRRYRNKFDPTQGSALIHLIEQKLAALGHPIETPSSAGVEISMSESDRAQWETACAAIANKSDAGTALAAASTIKDPVLQRFTYGYIMLRAATDEGFNEEWAQGAMGELKQSFAVAQKNRNRPIAAAAMIGQMHLIYRRDGSLPPKQGGVLRAILDDFPNFTTDTHVNHIFQLGERMIVEARMPASVPIVSEMPAVVGTPEVDIVEKMMTIPMGGSPSLPTSSQPSSSTLRTEEITIRETPTGGNLLGQILAIDPTQWKPKGLDVVTYAFLAGATRLLRQIVELPIVKTLLDKIHFQPLAAQEDTQLQKLLKGLKPAEGFIQQYFDQTEAIDEMFPGAFHQMASNIFPHDNVVLERNALLDVMFEEGWRRFADDRDDLWDPFVHKLSFSPELRANLMPLKLAIAQGDPDAIGENYGALHTAVVNFIETFQAEVQDYRLQYTDPDDVIAVYLGLADAMKRRVIEPSLPQPTPRPQKTVVKLEPIESTPPPTLSQSLQQSEVLSEPEFRIERPKRKERLTRDEITTVLENYITQYIGLGKEAMKYQSHTLSQLVIEKGQLVQSALILTKRFGMRKFTITATIGTEEGQGGMELNVTTDSKTVNLLMKPFQGKIKKEGPRQILEAVNEAFNRRSLQRATGLRIGKDDIELIY